MSISQLDKEQFRNNLIKRVKQVTDLAGATVEVGLRTAVWYPSKESVKGKDDLIAVITINNLLLH